MKLILDSSTFNDLQARFTAEIVTRIKIKLQEAAIESDRLEDLTAEIALSIAGVIDDLAGIDSDGVEVHPYLTFRTDDETLLHWGENAYTHEQVYGAMRKLFQRSP
ncbi:hypothetical protein [Thermochromatium tepidum]|jgi:hypothetical protein|uniref:Uncharacterized protein n=1 Tax=Thermochromatium tepidum ATCC 43061 TaxID=316276 RepID=A0A6I6ECR4_THETI|nr:hypothetical protein [Thermochromatium tepidum]QGU32729.1 hypothetical protein E6P07_06870 [Thermochromatium tepidum ATCC 43061]